MAILASPPPRLFAIWSTADCEISVVLTVEVAKEKKAVDGIDVPAHATQQTSADREMLLEAVDLEQRVSHGGGSLSLSKQAAKCAAVFASSGGASRLQRSVA